MPGHVIIKNKKLLKTDSKEYLSKLADITFSTKLPPVMISKPINIKSPIPKLTKAICNILRIFNLSKNIRLKKQINQTDRKVGLVNIANKANVKQK